MFIVIVDDFSVYNYIRETQGGSRTDSPAKPKFFATQFKVFSRALAVLGVLGFHGEESTEEQDKSLEKELVSNTERPRRF